VFRFHRSRANQRVPDIKEVKAVPLVLRSHLYIARMIRTISEELLDQAMFWSQLDPERKPSGFRI
jgi:hypothetical protein